MSNRPVLAYLGIVALALLLMLAGAAADLAGILP
jgi:hypothetical protein